MTFVLALTIALAGCASTANIDLSKVESSCGQTCSKNYSDCMGQFSVFPIRQYNSCAEGLRLCAQSCPARQ